MITTNQTTKQTPNLRMRLNRILRLSTSYILLVARLWISLEARRKKSRAEWLRSSSPQPNLNTTNVKSSFKGLTSKFGRQIRRMRLTILISVSFPSVVTLIYVVPSGKNIRKQKIKNLKKRLRKHSIKLTIF